MLEFVPQRQGRALPLVLVLHGCMQDARAFDAGTGWTALAQTHGFAVVFAQQKAVNNPNLCFNWFRPSQMRRDRGELGSIREMIANASERHVIDPSRIFVIGLSAGAVVAGILLATYPALFRAGALVAGLPVGAARDAMTALSAMKNGVEHEPAEWGAVVRDISPDASGWPRISIWHGTADSTVAIANGRASVAQWLDVHGLKSSSGETALSAGVRRTVWRRRAGGRIAVELRELEGFGHGMPVERTAGTKAPANETEKYLLPSALPAAEQMLTEWGLIGERGSLPA